MKKLHYDIYLRQAFELEITRGEGEEVVEGTLVSRRDPEKRVPVISGIPRFVDSASYADNFGLQWNAFRSTQLDSFSGLNLTFNRFWNNTKWKPKDVLGKTILEAGSGAGRFTEILLEAGANVVSFDLSSAVDANRTNNQEKGDLFLFQGDIFDLPLEEDLFDFVFSYGVLQHTPDPPAAYRALFKKLRKGGRLSIDCYRKEKSLSPWTTPKYAWRRVTSTMPPEKLMRIVRAYVPLWLPIDTIIRRIPRLGPLILSLLCVPCWNYLGMGLNKKQRVEWAIMDTFDALGARWDLPMTLEEMRDMVESAENERAEVFYGTSGKLVANVTRRLT